MTTIKQKLVAKEITENHRKSISKAMLKIGYAPSTASKPSNLTKSKGWNELMDKYLPDDELLSVHKKALHATKIHGSLTEPDCIVDDIPTSLKAVELGYKVKKKLSETNVNISGEKVIAILGGATLVPTDNSGKKDS